MSAKRSLLLFTVLCAGVGLSQVSLAAEKSGRVESQPSDSLQAESTEAHLGIGVSDLPPALASHLPDVIEKGRGLLISEVSKGSPAEKAGLRMHDVLIRYGEQDLYSPDQLVKLVRGDQPGKRIELEYVRAGKLAAVEVTLGEAPMREMIQQTWPDLTGKLDMPVFPLRPDFWAEKQDLLNDGTEWTHFESLSLSKDGDGKYRAEVTYKQEDGTTVEREYVGTRQEVRDAVNADPDLPESQRKQLLRSLDDRVGPETTDFPFRMLPRFDRWNRQWSDWPGIRF